MLDAGAAFASDGNATKPIKARESVSPVNLFMSFPSKKNSQAQSAFAGEPDLLYKTHKTGKELQFFLQSVYFRCFYLFVMELNNLTPVLVKPHEQE